MTLKLIISNFFKIKVPDEFFIRGVCFSGLLLFCHILVAQTFKKHVWSDEFNKPGLPDSTHWNYDHGTGKNGWGNNELQILSHFLLITKRYLNIEMNRKDLNTGFLIRNFI